MPRPKRKNRFILAPVQSALGLAILYIALVFIMPANKIAMQNYHLTAAQYHALVFVVLLPLMLIWIAAFYSYGKLQDYAHVIQKSPEGTDFALLAKGIQWLAWGLAVPNIISSILNAIANSHHSFLPTALITANYLTLFVPLIGFHYIRRGAQGLTDHAKIRLSMANMQILLSMFVVLGVVFCFFTFQHLNLNSLTSSENPYYLPAWLLIVSVIIPYLYAWFAGLLAAYELTLFSKQVPGVFYRQAVQLIAGGVVSVIASLVMIQYLRSVIPRTGHLSLSTTLILINIIYVFMAVGFILISMGSTKLKKIEEV